MISNIANYILHPIVIFNRLWRIIYFPLLYVFDLPTHNHNNEGNSHVLALIFSIITSILSPYSFYVLYNNYLYNKINTKLVEFVYNLSFSYFSSDLIIGMQFYQESLNKNILTSYIHHLVYLGLLLYSKYYDKTQLVIILLPYEIPTILLSLGHINNRYRNNILFGILFFIFRIIFNLYILYKSYMVYNDLFIVSIFTFILHAYWFSKFVKKYLIN